jgi:hypothetical protein
LTGDYDDESPWEAVRTLRRIGDREVCDRAAEWCRFDDPLKRARGGDVLVQLARTVEHPNNNLPEECFSLVSSLVQQEKEVLPLLSAVFLAMSAMSAGKFPELCHMLGRSSAG